MKTIKIDFSDVQGGGGQVPPGEYVGTVGNVLVRSPKDPTKNPYLNVAFKITQGPFTNRLVFLSLGLGDRALPFVKKFLQDLMVPIEESGEFRIEYDDSEEGKGRVTHPDLTGIPVLFEVTITERPGQTPLVDVINLRVDADRYDSYQVSGTPKGEDDYE